MRALLFFALGVGVLSLLSPSFAEARELPRGELLAQAKKTSAAAQRPGAARARSGPREGEASAASEDGKELRRGEKVEFDARLIQGQTAKAGAVFLFERVSSDLSSMVKERRSYRREIVEEVFPQEKDH